VALGEGEALRLVAEPGVAKRRDTSSCPSARTLTAKRPLSRDPGVGVRAVVDADEHQRGWRLHRAEGADREAEGVAAASAAWSPRDPLAKPGPSALRKEAASTAIRRHRCRALQLQLGREQPQPQGDPGRDHGLERGERPSSWLSSRSRRIRASRAPEEEDDGEPSTPTTRLLAPRAARRFLAPESRAGQEGQDGGQPLLAQPPSPSRATRPCGRGPAPGRGSACRPCRGRAGPLRDRLLRDPVHPAGERASQGRRRRRPREGEEAHPGRVFRSRSRPVDEAAHRPAPLRRAKDAQEAAGEKDLEQGGTAPRSRDRGSRQPLPGGPGRRSPCRGCPGRGPRTVPPASPTRPTPVVVEAVHHRPRGTRGGRGRPRAGRRAAPRATRARPRFTRRTRATRPQVAAHGAEAVAQGAQHTSPPPGRPSSSRFGARRGTGRPTLVAALRAGPARRSSRCWRVDVDRDPAARIHRGAQTFAPG